MTDASEMYIPEYVKDAIILGIILLVVLYNGSKHSPAFHSSSLYQDLSVLMATSFSFAGLSMFVDVFTGFALAKYEAVTNRLFVFFINVALVCIVYYIGAKYFGFNDVVSFY